MYSIVSAKISKFYQNIEYYGREDVNDFSIYNFLFIGTFLQLHTGFILHYLQYMIHTIPGLIYVLFIVETFLIGVPLHMFLLFLGSYTKMKVLRIWCCVPLFKGLGYTILLARNVVLIINQYFSTSFLYVLTQFVFRMTTADTFFMNCEFEHVTNTCVPMGRKGDRVCDNDQIYEMSMFQFTRIVLFKMDTIGVFENIFKIHNSLYLINLYLWILVLPFIFVGIKKLTKLFSILMGIFSASLLYLFLYMAFNYSIYNIPTLPYMAKGFETSYGNSQSLTFWVAGLIFSSASLDAGNTIWLGCQMPKSIQPNVASMIISLLKLLGLFANLMIIKFLMNTFVQIHLHLFKKCALPIPAFQIYFSVFFYIFLIEDPSTFHVFIFALGIGIYTFLDTVAVASIIVDSIIDEFPKLKKCRILICLSFCTINFLCSALFVGSNGTSLIILWNEHTSLIIGTVLFLLMSLMLNYIYSSEMLINDYIFTYKEEPSAVIMLAWAAAPIISLFVLAAVFFWLTFSDVRCPLSNSVKTASVMFSMLVFAPILICFVIALGRGVNNPNSLSPDRPDAAWGPYILERRKRRNQFVPHRDLCYRHNGVTCKHKCLMKVKDFEDEMQIQNNKYANALVKFQLTDSQGLYMFTPKKYSFLDYRDRYSSIYT